MRLAGPPVTMESASALFSDNKMGYGILYLNTYWKFSQHRPQFIAYFVYVVYSFKPTVYHMALVSMMVNLVYVVTVTDPAVYVIMKTFMTVSNKPKVTEHSVLGWWYINKFCFRPNIKKWHGFKSLYGIGNL